MSSSAGNKNANVLSRAAAFASSAYATWADKIDRRKKKRRGQSGDDESASALPPGAPIDYTPSPPKPAPFQYPPSAPAATSAAEMSKPAPIAAQASAAAVASGAVVPNSPILASSEFVTVIVLGASGDLAKKKTYPALYSLFKHDYLPPTAQIVGYARSNLALTDFHARLGDYLKKEDPVKVRAFLDRCHYVHGAYDTDPGYQTLNTTVATLETRFAGPGQSRNRVYYLALPPSVFIPVTTMLRKHGVADQGAWTRVIVEKPFGKDLESARELGRALASHWHEHELYRIDHYLGKEMVKNLISLRFANAFFYHVWNRQAIANVQITFKEKIGTEGRGGYFDEFGIVRDVMQNHLLQILTLVAMERPVSLDADDVRNEKVKVLRSMRPLTLKDMKLGQYAASADGSKPGYLDDATVPKGSKTPTYAGAAVYIDNDRWDGVPFILRCGKALNEAKTEVRIQFRDVPGGDVMFPTPLSRNELVIRVQPNESVYIKLMNKEPGLSFRQHITELDLSYRTRYEGLRIPDAYEALLLDVLRGDQANFVRDDELDAAWALFTPVLHAIDRGEADVEAYEYGSRGPAGLKEWMAGLGVARDRQEYVWAPKM